MDNKLLQAKIKLDKINEDNGNTYKQAKVVILEDNLIIGVILDKDMNIEVFNLSKE